ncbi:hypothetical protein ACTUTK_06970 [Pantoea ananatis]|uniref:hypothetical protein n=1 Tax=Pantoea ananas TaxID=553 RepID=UPI003FA4498F
MKRIIFAVVAMTSFGAFSAKTISIPTDTRARYTILDKVKKGSSATITTKREGPSGVSFSKRLYNCSAWTVKYLGDGETIEQMKSSKPDQNMSTIVENSIADYLGKQACR